MAEFLSLREAVKQYNPKPMAKVLGTRYGHRQRRACLEQDFYKFQTQRTPDIPGFVGNNSKCAHTLLGSDHSNRLTPSPLSWTSSSDESQTAAKRQ